VDTLSRTDRQPAQENLNAGNQLSRFERFCDIVIPANLQPDNFVHSLLTSAQEQDRGGQPRLPQVATQVEPTAVGQHNVENYEVEWLCGGFIETLFGIPRSIHDVSLTTEANTQSAAQGSHQ